MPKAPVTTRTLVWERLEDGTIHLLDWCLVNTSLGMMVESRCITKQTGDIRDEDLFDSSFTDMAVIPPAPSGNYAFDQVAFYNGAQWPHYRATDPGVE